MSLLENENTTQVLIKIIQTLSYNPDDVRQREKQKQTVEFQYQNADTHVEKLIRNHRDELHQVLNIIGIICDRVTESRRILKSVRDSLSSSKNLLTIKFDEIRTLWMESLQNKLIYSFLEKTDNLRKSIYLVHTLTIQNEWLLASKLYEESNLHLQQLNKQLFEALSSNGNGSGITNNEQVRIPSNLTGLDDLRKKLKSSKDELESSMKNRLNYCIFSHPLHLLLPSQLLRQSGKNINDMDDKQQQQPQSQQYLQNQENQNNKNKSGENDLLLDDENRSLNSNFWIQRITSDQMAYQHNRLYQPPDIMVGRRMERDVGELQYEILASLRHQRRIHEENISKRYFHRSINDQTELLTLSKFSTITTEQINLKSSRVADSDNVSKEIEELCASIIILNEMNKKDEKYCQHFYEIIVREHLNEKMSEAMLLFRLAVSNIFGNGRCINGQLLALFIDMTTQYCQLTKRNIEITKKILLSVKNDPNELMEIDRQMNSTLMIYICRHLIDMKFHHSSFNNDLLPNDIQHDNLSLYSLQLNNFILPKSLTISKKNNSMKSSDRHQQQQRHQLKIKNNFNLPPDFLNALFTQTNRAQRIINRFGVPGLTEEKKNSFYRLYGKRYRLTDIGVSFHIGQFLTSIREKFDQQNIYEHFNDKQQQQQQQHDDDESGFNGNERNFKINDPIYELPPILFNGASEHLITLLPTVLRLTSTQIGEELKKKLNIFISDIWVNNIVNEAKCLLEEASNITENLKEQLMELQEKGQNMKLTEEQIEITKFAYFNKHIDIYDTICALPAWSIDERTNLDLLPPSVLSFSVKIGKAIWELGKVMEKIPTHSIILSEKAINLIITFRSWVDQNIKIILGTLHNEAFSSRHTFDNDLKIFYTNLPNWQIVLRCQLASSSSNSTTSTSNNSIGGITTTTIYQPTSVISDAEKIHFKLVNSLHQNFIQQKCQIGKTELIWNKKSLSRLLHLHSTLHWLQELLQKTHLAPLENLIKSLDNTNRMKTIVKNEKNLFTDKEIDELSQYIKMLLVTCQNCTSTSMNQLLLPLYLEIRFICLRYLQPLLRNKKITDEHLFQLTDQEQSTINLFGNAILQNATAPLTGTNSSSTSTNPILNNANTTNQTKKEVDSVLLLTRKLHEIYDLFRSSVSRKRLECIWDGIGYLVYHILVHGVSKDIQISDHYISQIQRNIFAIEQALVSHQDQTTSTALVTKAQLMKAYRYFELFHWTPHEILDSIDYNSNEFTEADYSNVLEHLTKKYSFGPKETNDVIKQLTLIFQRINKHGHHHHHHNNNPSSQSTSTVYSDTDQRSLQSSQQ
ncbi:hypothetical protein SNEBB_002183 [Seison nebaliae]|nr:hypothetical protein SNEBB_002183 [Seison nebaliae]